MLLHKLIFPATYNTTPLQDELPTKIAQYNSTFTAAYAVRGIAQSVLEAIGMAWSISLSAKV